MDAIEAQGCCENFPIWQHVVGTPVSSIASLTIGVLLQNEKHVHPQALK
jgi:hypothetical protein